MSLAVTPACTNLGEFGLAPNSGTQPETHVIHQGSCCVLAIFAHLRGLLIGDALLDLILIRRQETAVHVDILVALAVIQLALPGDSKTSA